VAEPYVSRSCHGLVNQSGRVFVYTPTIVHFVCFALFVVYVAAFRVGSRRLTHGDGEININT
jgi:hypothetical protein